MFFCKTTFFINNYVLIACRIVAVGLSATLDYTCKRWGCNISLMVARITSFRTLVQQCFEKNTVFINALFFITRHFFHDNIVFIKTNNVLTACRIVAVGLPPTLDYTCQWWGCNISLMVARINSFRTLALYKQHHFSSFQEGYILVKIFCLKPKYWICACGIVVLGLSPTLDYTCYHNVVYNKHC